MGHFGIEDGNVPDLPDRFNVAPTQPIPILRSPGKLELLRWGLLPHGGPPSGGARGINVRVETVARAPMYRESFHKRRCIVVLSAFYEWERREKRKQPFLIERRDHEPLAFAGIWDRSVTEDGEVIESCAILTCPSVGVVAKLHDRMPLILSPEQYGPWLDPATADPTKLLHGADVELEAVPVSTLVNDVANDGPELVRPTADDRVGETGRLF